jgi:hypothetical protein
MRILLAALAIAGTAVSLLGQNAALSGLIKDPTEAAIPRAEVIVINQDTGVKRETISRATPVSIR